MKGLGIVGDKSYAFALRIVKSYKYLTTQGEYVLSKQLLRSGTAIGALCCEAQQAQSKADFLNKMNIALKEATETEYWIKLLKDSDYFDTAMYESLMADCMDLVKLLIAIVKTTKLNLAKERSK